MPRHASCGTVGVAARTGVRVDRCGPADVFGLRCGNDCRTVDRALALSVARLSCARCCAASSVVVSDTRPWWPMKFAPQPCHVCRVPSEVRELVVCDHGDPKVMWLRHDACTCATCGA